LTLQKHKSLLKKGLGGKEEDRKLSKRGRPRWATKRPQTAGDSTDINESPKNWRRGDQEKKIRQQQNLFLFI